LKDRAKSQKIVPDASAKLEYENAPGLEINIKEESKKEEPQEVFQSVMPEPEKQNRLSMNTAKNEPQEVAPAAADQVTDLNTNTLHVPFIQQRISDIKDDIEKEKTKQVQI